MKLRNEWMSDSQYFGDNYPNNLLLEDAVRRFETQRDESLEGKVAIVDGVQERIVVQNHLNPLNQEKYDKKIHFSMDSLIRTGSILNFENKTWLVISKIFENIGYKTASVLECISTLTFYKSNISPVPVLIPYVTFDNVALTRMGVDGSKYLIEPHSKFMVMVSDNQINRNISRDDIYRMYDIDGQVDNYKVLDINRVRKPGLIILELEYSQESQPEYTYTINILNGLNLDIQENSTLQLNIQVLVNDNPVSPTPPLLFSSNNEDIATVDENGLLTTYDIIDSCEIVVRLANDESVQQIVNINVIEDVVDNFTYLLNGDSEIIRGNTKTYIAQKFNNGEFIPGEFEFSIIPGSTPANAYNLVIINGNECRITANNSVYDILLRATDVDSGQFVDKNIRLRNLF